MTTITTQNFTITEPTAVTLGNFDGFHRGHRTLINKIKSFPCKTVIFTFTPHPIGFFSSDGSFKTICTEEEKRSIAETLEVDYYITYPFTNDFASLSPADFTALLKEKTNCRYLAIGRDFSFGKNKSGNADTLKATGKDLGIEVTVMPKLKYKGEDISSTKIRACLQAGDVKTAAILLGAPYFISSRVEKGLHRGTGMGFPTANQLVFKNKLLPKDGVYATTAIIEGIAYKAITNIGKNPTFQNDSRTVETYILNQTQNLYQKAIKIEFKELIRDEIKFPDKAALKAQIEKDINAAKVL